MKLATKLIFLLFITSILVIGCDISSGSPSNPRNEENLLNDNITYDKSREKLYTFVNKSLDGTTLTLPKNSSQVGQINELGSDIIAFQQKEDVNINVNKVGFVLISKKNNEYVLEDSCLEEGEEIEYANFYDINNDNMDEVILLVNNGSITTMNVYTIKNNKIKKISEVRPTWLKDFEKFTSMKIEVGRISDESKGKKDILMLNSDNSSGDMYATVLNYDKNNILNRSNSVKITNVKNLEELYVKIGKVYNNKKGVILSIPTLKENGYATQILSMKDKTLKKAFNNNDVIFNPYYVPAKDVNNDGVINIPVLNNKMIENYTTNSKVSSLITWRKWNDKFGKDANTIFISQVYYNYKHNFKFLIPDNLANKLYIQKNVVGDTLYYVFYHYDDNKKESTELFQISVSPKNIVEDAQSNSKIESVLAETNNNYYQLIVKNKNEFEKYDLTLDNMKEYFSIIYK
ncbi:hypothetical protein [Terrisporobacter sp.]